VNQKRADALAMIKTMHEFLATDPPPMRALAFSTPPCGSAQSLRCSRPQRTTEEADALEELRLDSVRFHELRQQVLNLPRRRGGCRRAGSGKTGTAA
jgi:hypothetical protein